MNLYTSKGTLIEDAHITHVQPATAGYHPTTGVQFSDTKFLVKLTGDSLTLSDVEDPCGRCEECEVSGMPQYCTSPISVNAYYYKGERIWGSPEEGFIVHKGE